MLRIAIISFLTVASLYVRAQGSIQIEISFPEKAMKGKKIIKSVEYVPLETTSDCLIGESAWFYITNEYIVIAHFFEGKALLFDRKTGRFIHEIGRAGQGPGEYTGFWAANGFNEKEQLLYMHEWHQWKAYDIQTGKLKQIIKSPGEKYVIQNPYLYKQGVYLGYANNTTGKVPYKLIAFDKEGKISKIYPQYNQIELNLAKGEYPMNVGLFYEFDSNVYFQEANTDSVFQVTDEVLEPHICFKHPKEISFPEIWGETTHYVVSRFRMKEHAYIAIYDKKENIENHNLLLTFSERTVTQVQHHRPPVVSGHSYLMGRDRLYCGIFSQFVFLGEICTYRAMRIIQESLVGCPHGPIGTVADHYPLGKGHYPLIERDCIPPRHFPAVYVILYDRIVLVQHHQGIVPVPLEIIHIRAKKNVFAEGDRETSHCPAQTVQKMDPVAGPEEHLELVVLQIVYLSDGPAQRLVEFDSPYRPARTVEQTDVVI